MSQNDSLMPQSLEKIITNKETKVYSFDYYGLINPGSLKTINNACRKLSSI